MQITVSSVYSQSPTLDEKIAQMIFVGYGGTSVPDTLIADLKTRNVGGVILFAANVTSQAQIRRVTDSLRLIAKTTPFIAIDQEGGRVARLSRANGFDTSYTAYNLGTLINAEDTTRWIARTMAGWLQQCGINVNFAPVVDVNINPNSPAIGAKERSFSKYSDSVYNHAKWFIDEFHQKNIITCLKHFPGHGSASTDSHDGFTDITSTWADSELIPYRKLIANGFSDFVMSGHLFNANLDTSYPSSLSPNCITGILRNQLSFNGLTITDGLGMGALTQNYTFDQIITNSINAGNNFLLYTSNLRNNKALVPQVLSIVKSKIQSGVISQSKIDDAYNRIIAMKRKYGLITTSTDEYAANIPAQFSLGAYPNPFNSSAVIQFRLSERGRAVLTIYDQLGQRVSELFEGDREAGIHKINFYAKELPSGIYFCELRTQSARAVQKLIVIK